MKIRVFENQLEAKTAAAEQIADSLDGNSAKLVCATGGTMVEFYREFCRTNQDRAIDLRGVRFFNLDEYYGIEMDPALPEGKDQSFARYLSDNLFRPLGIDVDSQVRLVPHREDGLEQYRTELACSGGELITILGIGKNGHIAFNEPGTMIEDSIRVVNLSEGTIIDNYKANFEAFGYSFDEMPRKACTIGPREILSSNRIIVLCFGKTKKHAFEQAVFGTIDASCPASYLQTHENVEWYVDSALLR
ncbi:MAG: 6-phosphogluconolactonase [Planctomycetes bacterium]|nr:6-phosphogluconolactonase [Planctomycetota bacterium]MCR4318225.1 6-phosphogluconolactonase [Planctomycetota bacterium]